MEHLEINHVHVQERPTFDQRGNVSARVEYSYFVGTHGPFTLTYAKGADTAAQVQADMQAQVQKLKAIVPGAMPGA